MHYMHMEIVLFFKKNYKYKKELLDLMKTFSYLVSVILKISNDFLCSQNSNKLNYKSKITSPQIMLLRIAC